MLTAVPFHDPETGPRRSAEFFPTLKAWQRKRSLGAESALLGIDISIPHGRGKQPRPGKLQNTGSVTVFFVARNIDDQFR